MAYTAPSTVSTLQTYTSAAHNVIVNDIIDHESRINTVQNAQYALKNLLINGAMQFAQRGTSVTGISSGTNRYDTADRWATSVSALGTYTSAISADAPTGSGFRNSLRMTVSASAATAASALVTVQQRLEGQTLQMIRKGTSSAQQLTISFWVKGNTTGTYIAELTDVDNTRSVSASYIINSADTWEQKTITFPADTTGAFDNDNAASLDVRFWLAAASTYTSGSLATAWGATTTANRAVGQTNISAAAANYWAITGVQLEVGSVASPYEFLQYDEELRRCQRYYYRTTNVSGVVRYAGMGQCRTGTVFALIGSVGLPVTMRTDATITGSGWQVENPAGTLVALNTAAITSVTTPNNAGFYVQRSTGTFAASEPVLFILDNNGWLAASAEL